MCLGPELVDLRLHAALTKKRKISDSNAVVWCADCFYTPYTFTIMREGKEEEEERKKKEKRRTKPKLLCSIFSTVKRSNGTLGLYFT